MSCKCLGFLQWFLRNGKSLARLAVMISGHGTIAEAARTVSGWTICGGERVKCPLTCAWTWRRSGEWCAGRSGSGKNSQKHLRCNVFPWYSHANGRAYFIERPYALNSD
jgi:hypothetical protein